MILHQYGVARNLSSRIGRGTVNARNGNDSFTLFQTPRSKILKLIVDANIANAKIDLF